MGGRLLRLQLLGAAVGARGGEVITAAGLGRGQRVSGAGPRAVGGRMRAEGATVAPAAPS
ncbi:hypothetical protein GCM10022203_21200 [Micrococcus yunnanensis]